MPQPCSIETCKRKSCAVCHCCQKNLCIIHLNEHHDLSKSQLNNFLGEVNILAEHLLVLDGEINDKCHQKLDKWRDNSFMVINHYYEEKNQEIQQHFIERVGKYGREIDKIKGKINDLITDGEATYEDIPPLKSTIDNIKHDIKLFQEKGIIIDIQPIIITKDLIQIKEWSSNDFDISILPPPFQTINCSNEDWPTMATNNQYLLIDQYPNLHLFDKELNLVKQLSWKYDRIPDMCWSSTLNSFIIITDKDGVFLFNGNTESFEPIQTIEKKDWLSCTCSENTLFLTTPKHGSDIYEFNLLSSFDVIKQWNAPKSCNDNELINNINYNNGTLAVIISHGFKETLKLELLSSKTLDRLWSLFLDTLYNIDRIYRLCSLKYDEWLVIDHNTSQLFHITKDGKLKVIQKYNPIPQNAVLFDSNILAIRTTNCVNFL